MPINIQVFSRGYDLSFGTKLSLHQISLTDVLQMAALTGAKPKTVIIAVQPKDVSEWGLELSDEVRMAMPKVKELVLDELRKIKAMGNHLKITTKP